MNTFYFNGNEYQYANHPAERAIEAPICKAFIDKYGNALEVGNVLHYFYKNIDHIVLDKYEKLPYVINEDIIEYKPNKVYDAILCISTLEHIGDGWAGEPKNRELAISAYKNMQQLLKPGGTLLCTWPIGFNTDLDSWLKNGFLEFTKILAMKRISSDNKWVEISPNEAFNCKYENPFIAGNGIVFVYYKNEGRKMIYKDSIDFSAGLINPLEYDFLAEYVKKYGIKTILEFGPGISTWAFLENDCQIASFEYTDWFYQYHVKQFEQFDNVSIRKYDNKPEIDMALNKRYDMAFIDSPVGVNKSIARLNTCMFASKYTNRILLHDSNRIGEIVTQMFFAERGWRVMRVLDSYCGICEMIHD